MTIKKYNRSNGSDVVKIRFGDTQDVKQIML